MDLSPNIKLNPPSPIYEVEASGGAASHRSNAKKLLTISGNLYHTWLPVDWPLAGEEEKQQVETVPGISTKSGSKDLKPDIKEKETPDIISRSIKDIAALCQFTDQNLSPPKIENTKINWVDEWTKSTYRDLGMEEQKSEEGEDHDILYEVLSSPHTKEDVNPLEHMKESNFLKWLKNKDARGKGFSEIKTEEKEAVSKPEARQKKTVEEPPSKAISKKKKKKELKKILKKSLEMEDEIISETLARVMVQQGHTKKARELYEKLSLIFPEKSGYFAQIIENLEEE